MAASTEGIQGMKLYRSLKALQADQIPSVVTIGMFDGLHRGHQQLMKQTLKSAFDCGLRSVVFTFSRHPRQVLKHVDKPAPLYTMAQKANLLAKQGLDTAVVIRFSRAFSRLSPRCFVQQYLVDGLQMKELVVGENFRFGAGAAGDVSLLKKLGSELGFSVRSVLSRTQGDERISSSRIRESILNGDLQQAEKMLGREYWIDGRVVHGRGIATKLGFPTANLSLEEQLLPKNGVWAGLVEMKGGKRDHQFLPFIANLGIRPTFYVKGDLHLEVHFPDFEGKLYGQHMAVRFMRFLRKEKKFNSRVELRRQIAKDVSLFQKWKGDQAFSFSS